MGLDMDKVTQESVKSGFQFLTNIGLVVPLHEVRKLWPTTMVFHPDSGGACRTGCK
jgi:hypothetical protein